jgi:hypothetical protein
MPHRALVAALVTSAHARAGHDAHRRLSADLVERCWPAGIPDRHDPLARLNLRISFSSSLLAIEPATPSFN